MCCKLGGAFGVSCVYIFTLCSEVLWLAQRLCQHASGVMPISAPGFLTHCIASFAQYYCILCQHWRSVFLFWSCVWYELCVSFHIVCTSAIVCPKIIPECSQGYANRRPGIFYTFHCIFLPILLDLGRTLSSSFVNLMMRLV